jgi:hypothetical protein
VETRATGHPGRAWAGVAAPVVFLGGALLMSNVERDFMDRLGWDVWPSGLALGPVGWGEILVFIVFAALYITFALYVRDRARWSRVSTWGGYLMLGGAGFSLLLAFKTDRMNADITWHGALHAAGYGALMISMLIAFVLIYPSLIRRSSITQWKMAPAALLLIPPAWLMPTSEGTSGYLFFAIPFVLLAVLALVLGRSPIDPLGDLRSTADT